MALAKFLTAGFAAASLLTAGVATAAPAQVNTLVAPATTSLTAKKLHRLSAPVSASSHAHSATIIIPAGIAFGVGAYFLIDQGHTRSPGA